MGTPHVGLARVLVHCWASEGLGWGMVGFVLVWAGKGICYLAGKKIVHQLCENWRIGRTDDFLLWFTSHFQFLKCSGLKPSVTK